MLFPREYFYILLTSLYLRDEIDWPTVATCNMIYFIMVTQGQEKSLSQMYQMTVSHLFLFCIYCLPQAEWKLF